MKSPRQEILRRYGIFAIFFLMTLISSLHVSAQTSPVKGTVKDEAGIAMPGVNVTVQGTKTAAVTDASGNFSINAANGNVLIASFIGYNPQTVTVGDSPQLDIVLKAASNSLNEVVVVGYGTQKKENLTGSIAVVNVKDANNRAIFYVARALQGQVGGVVVNGSGVPGEGVTIHIRGC